MSTIPLTALMLLFAMVGLYADTPKSGQSLGTITTEDGKTYADAKLALVEPDAHVLRERWPTMATPQQFPALLGMAFTALGLQTPETVTKILECQPHCS